MMVAVLILALAALAGSLPFGAWIARFYHIDLRQHGSGNVGATNVYRTLGWKPGVVALALDVLKGAFAVTVARSWMPDHGGLQALAGVATVLGHVWSPFLGFRGGKGVATSLGVFVALAPIPGLLILSVWLGVTCLSGWISLASVMAALFLPVGVLFDRSGLGPRFPWILGMSVVLAILVVLRHRANWERLVSGTETQIWDKTSAGKESAAKENHD